MTMGKRSRKVGWEVTYCHRWTVVGRGWVQCSGRREFASPTVKVSVAPASPLTSTSANKCFPELEVVRSSLRVGSEDGRCISGACNTRLHRVSAALLPAPMIDFHARPVFTRAVCLRAAPNNAPLSSAQRDVAE